MVLTGTTAASDSLISVPTRAGAAEAIAFERSMYGEGEILAEHAFFNSKGGVPTRWRKI